MAKLDEQYTSLTSYLQTQIDNSTGELKRAYMEALTKVLDEQINLKKEISLRLSSLENMVLTTQNNVAQNTTSLSNIAQTQTAIREEMHTFIRELNGQTDSTLGQAIREIQHRQTHSIVPIIPGRQNVRGFGNI